MAALLEVSNLHAAYGLTRVLHGIVAMQAIVGRNLHATGQRRKRADDQRRDGQRGHQLHQHSLTQAAVGDPQTRTWEGAADRFQDGAAGEYQIGALGANAENHTLSRPRKPLEP